ncbi:hypothetical protein BJ085DRAFT_38299 [Dimargaris cristalligena]|uniref:Uncharacterized protein n=1 Tax=Dimargaris cristalligena TaxID=215637 RepID=A0A4Q0A172_9FUNG|nr:hypothetical protein BJ085DRAFT_38299 [Dimargaris cristalligena]|eukprot:RKP39823.1 hypothetical protein BJ085DRAFT_38299 [Dimargaris cristalligena]
MPIQLTPSHLDESHHHHPATDSGSETQSNRGSSSTTATGTLNGTATTSYSHHQMKQRNTSTSTNAKGNGNTTTTTSTNAAGGGSAASPSVLSSLRAQSAVSSYQQRQHGFVRRFFEAVKLSIYQYEVTTGLYMLEPWEKTIFNSIVLVGLLFSMYTAYTYMPTYMRNFATKVIEYSSI